MPLIQGLQDETTSAASAAQARFATVTNQNDTASLTRGDENERRRNGNNEDVLVNKDCQSQSSEDEGNGGIRPHKLFPVQNPHDELLRKVRSVLNKVSSVNYNRLRKRWLSFMPAGSEEKVEDGEMRLTLTEMEEVLHLVIAKALDDTIYMHIYAGLMGYVIARKPKEISRKIQQLICSHMNRELQKLTTDKELALHNRSTQLVDAARRKKVTLHRFIAELYGEKAVTTKFLCERVMDLQFARNPNNPVDIDENVECLCVLMTFAGQKLEESKKVWVEEAFSKLAERQTETPSMVSKRIQFMILDLMEMRSNGWSPHNKWWSPSVQRMPERERTVSSPSPSTSTYQHPRRSERSQEEPPKKVVKKQKKHHMRSRTQSEGSGLTSSSQEDRDSEGRIETEERSQPASSQNCSIQVSSPGPEILSQKHSQQQQQPKTDTTTTATMQATLSKTKAYPPSRKELTPTQRALMALLNKVSPLNVDRIAQQLYEVISPATFDEAAGFIVEKILDDAFYSRTHAALLFRVSCMPGMREFGMKVCERVRSIVKKSPESKEGFQLIAELYNLRMLDHRQVMEALDWLRSCSSSTVCAAMESLVIFLVIAGAKFDAELNDEKWINELIGYWERRATEVSYNQGRPLCLLRDVIELRQNKWACQRLPHWIPPPIDLPTIRFEPDSLIRLFQSDRGEFLRFITSGTSSLPRIEKFSKEALKYAVRFGNCDRDPEFLKATGVCLRVLLQQRLLRRDQLQGFLGGFVNDVVHMVRVNGRAWNNFGLIMREVY